jgi:hypothetical protein
MFSWRKPREVVEHNDVPGATTMNSLSSSFTRAVSMYPLVAALLVFWTTTHLAEIFDWDMGSERALVLLAVLFATPVLVRLASVNLRMPSPRPASMVLAVIVCAVLGWHLLSFYENFLNPGLIDIAVARGQRFVALSDTTNYIVTG